MLHGVNNQETSSSSQVNQVISTLRKTLTPKSERIVHTYRRVVMDSDSSSLDTSSIDDTEARKQYLKAISPKVPPTSHTPVQTSEKAFGNLFSKAGLESDDDTSQPSGANTSVSSESSRKSSMQRSPSSKPSSISKSSSRPSSVRSSLVERESNLGSDSSSSLSDIKPHKPTGAATTSLDDLPESTTSTSMRSKWKSTKNDSVSHSSARDESLSRGSSLASSDDSRKDRREQEHSDVDSTSRKSEASSQTPSRTESRSMPSHASSKEEIESKSSPQDYSDKSARNQESSHSLSQESERSRPQTPESASTSSQVQGIRSGSIQRHDSGSESTSKGELSLQRSNSSQSDSGGPVRTETSSKTSGTEESKEVDSVPLQAEIKGSRVHATTAIPSPPSSSDSKAHTESALSANTQSDHEKSESKDSKGSGSKEILDIEAKRLLGLEEPMNNEPKPKQLPIGVSKESPTERTQSIHDQVDVSPVVRLSEKSSKEVNQVSLPPKSLSQNSSKELKSSPDGHKDSLEEPPIVAAPRISILKKLEERRRALQTQPTTPSEGSHGSGASRCINGKAEDSQSAQEITELTIERTDKEAKQIGDETIDKLTLDDPSSKLDSQSEYDPRKDEREKWKALVKRSALGTSSDPRGPANLRRGRSENSGDEMKLISPLEDTPKEKERKTTDENAYLNDVEDRGAVNNRTREDRNGWVPPALTTYGDNMYSPDTEQEDKLDPPTDLVIRVAKTLPPRKGTSSPSTLHKAFLPPVSEIEVKPPPEDDSSLGSMGFLFPKLSPEISEVVPGNMDHLTAAPVEPKRDPQLVTHRLKPTVGGVDYDYYKSWILPGAQPPQPKQTKILEIEREDPPGTSTVFKPKRVFVNPFPPTRRLEKVMEGNPESSNVQASLANLASESWAPTRPVYIPAQTKSSDEWDAWKEARNASANKDSSNPSAKISIRSDISSTSDWGPPNGPLAPKVRQSKKEVETPRHTGSHWIPPSRSSRLDFAGSITTQATSSTQAQPNYKDPQFSSAREVPPDYQRKSSSTLKSHRSFISEEISSRTPESKDDDSLKHSSESASSSRISSSASTSSRSRQSAPPERKEDLSPVVDELTEEITANPTSTMSGDGHGSTPIRTAHPARAEKKFSRATVCLCVTISLLALGGIVAIVVFILTDRFAQEDSSPVRAPTAPSPTAAPILSAIDLNALIVSTSPGTETSLKTPGSPQSLALSWLSGNQFLAAYSDEKKIQRFVIAVLFYSTSGDSWTQKDLWLSDIDECDWYFSETVNEICNSGGAIDEIDLKDNGLRGEFPWTEIVMLASQLLILDLKGNNISGPISDDVGDLVTLLVFDVQGNGFSGTIPPSFGQLIDTRQLDLSENQLTGSLPSEIASMSSLQSLLVNNNLLTGSIPSELGQLTNVRSIYLVSLVLPQSMENDCGTHSFESTSERKQFCWQHARGNLCP